MPNYTATIESPLDPSEVWARVSDVTRFAEWDPGVSRSIQVAGSGPGPDAAYLLTVKSIRGALDLRYEVTRFESPRLLTLVADTGVLRSEDEVTVEARSGGTRLTYHAELAFSGWAALANPILALAFSRIGDRAAAGLRRFVDAE